MIKSVTVIAALLSAVSGRTMNDTKRVLDHCLSGYNKNVRPIADQLSPLNVTMGLHLLKLQEFNEVQERISVVALLVLSWHDENMVWNPYQYNRVMVVKAAYKDVWIPDVVFANPAEENDRLGEDWHLITYLATGDAFWYPSKLLKTTCSANIQRFPFDIQECDIQFQAFGYVIGEIEFQRWWDDVQKEDYEESSGWSLLGTAVKVDSLGFQSRITFSLTLQRKPAFVVINVLLPIVFLSLLNVLVFLLPVESGERMSCCITVLLAIAVFMTIVSETLPKCSEPTPIISYFLASEMVLSSLITLVATLNLKLFYEGETTPVPHWLLALERWLCACCGPRDKPPVYVQDDQSAKTFSLSTVIQGDVTDRTIGTQTEDIGVNRSVTWREISNLIDKMALGAFVLANVACVLLFVFVTWGAGKH